MISQCHNHPKCSHCFMCGKAINWVRDYGHEFPDGLASCNTCYDAKASARVWKKLDIIREKQPHMFDECLFRLKELEDF